MTATAAATRPARARMLGMRGVALVLVVAAAWLIVAEWLVRSLETALLGILLDAVGVTASVSGTIVRFSLGGFDSAGLNISLGCSSGPLVAFFLCVCAAIVWFRPPAAGRLALAIVGLVAGLLLVNQIRLLTIVGAIRVFGADTGFSVAHVLIGSVITIIGFCGAVLLCFRLLILRPHPSSGGAP